MPLVLSDGSVVAVLPTLNVSQRVLEEIISWKRAGASVDDVLDRLRLTCVPHGYTPMPWSAGMCSSTGHNTVQPLYSPSEFWP